MVSVVVPPTGTSSAGTPFFCIVSTVSAASSVPPATFVASIVVVSGVPALIAVNVISGSFRSTTIDRRQQPNHRLAQRIIEPGSLPLPVLPVDADQPRRTTSRARAILTLDL